MALDELGDYGMVRMDDDEIRAFLANRRVGVLGLPAPDGPYMVPLSFSFDGESRLYFTFVVGASSRKAALSREAGAARFLVYSVETVFNWQSVLLTGGVDEVPESERDRVRDAMDIAWQPDLFETASASEDTELYQFRIDDWDGIKHTGLPPGFTDGDAED